jgi:CelD/BcsL family acetyltransferase involved in cellulose biosynthesis
MSSTTLFRTEAEIARAKAKARMPVVVATSVGPVSLRVTDSFAGLELLWEELQQTARCTAPQTYAWARAWARHGLGPEGREPVIAIGCGADGEPLFLWAFETARRGGLTVLGWLGQDHANYNMGLFTPEAAAKFSAQDIDALLHAVALRTGAAAAVLKAQPFDWDGVRNPFAALPHQDAPNAGYAVKLGDYEELFERRFGKRSRSNFVRKERKLAEAGPLTYGWAESKDEKLAVMDSFFAQKSRQLAAMGVGEIFNVYARAFYREIALLEGDNPSRLRLGYLKAGDTVAAIFCGALCHDRLGVALSSIGEGEMQRQSPGALLLRHQIEEACQKGLAFYDIGVGTARHKEQWCDVRQPLFDSFIALRPEGLVLTLPLAAVARAKRAIKSNPYLWPLVQRWRRNLLGRATEGHDQA